MNKGEAKYDGSMVHIENIDCYIIYMMMNDLDDKINSDFDESIIRFNW